MATVLASLQGWQRIQVGPYPRQQGQQLRLGGVVAARQHLGRQGLPRGLQRLVESCSRPNMRATWALSAPLWRTSSFCVAPGWRPMKFSARTSLKVRSGCTEVMARTMRAR